MTDRNLIAGWLITCVTLGSTPALADPFWDRQVDSHLRLATWNANWDTFDNFASGPTPLRQRFERVAAAVDADVWALQEVEQPGFGGPSVAQLEAMMDAVVPLGSGAGWHAYRSGGNTILSKWSISESVGSLPGADRPVATGLIDLPDHRFATDFYLVNTHHRCCGGFDAERQRQSDAIVAHLRDARQPGGAITLPMGTALAVLGDLNVVDGLRPLFTLLTGDILDEATHGPDSPPDWDGTGFADAAPGRNGGNGASTTYENPFYGPSRLDYALFSDSVLWETHSYVLDTRAMSDAELALAGLQRFDSVYSPELPDHLPVVVDFAVVPEPGAIAGLSVLLVLSRVRRDPAG